jgi:SAM-dependent methyltransferase
MRRPIKQLKKDFAPSASRIWYNKWIEENAKGMVLDVGRSDRWRYHFSTIDINPNMRPTFLGNIEKTSFPNECFDTVLCNGMYEYVDNPQAMIDEVLRITKGTAIFGFVGKDYKPSKEPWKFYEGKEIIPNQVECKDFGNEYHYIICKK